MSSGAGAWNSRFWWDSVLCFNLLVGVCAIEDMMEIKKMVFALRLPCLLWLFGLGAALKGWVILTSSRNPFKHTPPNISQNIKKTLLRLLRFLKKSKMSNYPGDVCETDYVQFGRDILFITSYRSRKWAFFDYLKLYTIY